MARCRRLSILTLVCLISPAWATHTETRQYSILVDGKEAGQSQITIIEQDDGRAYMTASAKVQLKGLVVNYDFTIEGQEWWKDGKLVGMKALCNDNGKRCDLLVTQQAGQLTARVNGIDRGVHPDVWTTSYWKLADARFHNKPVPLLAANTGQERAGQLQYVGSKQLPVGNQLVACYHFRVTGGEQPVDLWFDQHHRLVRQEFTRSGHKTIIQLVGKR
jgi:Family of unknown function (DUF6134)